MPRSNASRPPPIRRFGLIPAACAAGLLLTLGGCPYRIDVQQGNVLEQESVEQVEVGMTRSQVQFLLGTPLVADPFHTDRWDYTYYFRQGRDRDVVRRWVSVYFEDDRVARVEQRLGPDGTQEAATEIASRSDDQ